MEIEPSSPCSSPRTSMPQRRPRPHRRRTGPARAQAYDQSRIAACPRPQCSAAQLQDGARQLLEPKASLIPRSSMMRSSSDQQQHVQHQRLTPLPTDTRTLIRHDARLQELRAYNVTLPKQHHIGATDRRKTPDRQHRHRSTAQMITLTRGTRPQQASTSRHLVHSGPTLPTILLDRTTQLPARRRLRRSGAQACRRRSTSGWCPEFVTIISEHSGWRTETLKHPRPRTLQRSADDQELLLRESVPPLRRAARRRWWTRPWLRIEERR